MFWKKKRPNKSHPPREAGKGWDPHDVWNLSRPVFAFGNSTLNLEDCVNGWQVFGMPGSGKTLGISKFMLHNLIGGLGAGAVITTAKIDDTDMYRRVAADCGASERLIVFGPDSAWRFNPFKWFSQRQGRGAGEVANLVSMLIRLVELLDPSYKMNSGNDSGYWMTQLEMLLTNCVELVMRAQGYITVKDLHDCVLGIAPNREAVETEGWQMNSATARFLIQAKERLDSMTPRQQSDFLLTATYFVEEIPGLDQRPKSIVTGMASALMNKLLRGAIAELLGSDTPNLVPEVCFDGGVIVLDMPYREWETTGLMLQTVFKWCFEAAAETRDVNKNPRPVLLHIDESPFFVNDRDADFVRTSRSQRVVPIFLAQDVNSFYSSGMSKEKADSFFANTIVKVFCLNGDSATNMYAANCISKNMILRPNIHTGKDEGSVGMTEIEQYEVMPREFQYLRNGSDRVGGLIDSVIFKPGHIFEDTGKNYMRATFQRST